MNTKNTKNTKPAAALPSGFMPIGGAGWNGGGIWLPHLTPDEAATKAAKIDNAEANTGPLLTGELRRCKAFGRDSFTVGGVLVPDHGMLAARLGAVDDGVEVACLYQGQQRIEKGQYKGKLAHTYQVGARQTELPF